MGLTLLGYDYRTLLSRMEPYAIMSLRCDLIDGKPRTEVARDESTVTGTMAVGFILGMLFAAPSRPAGTNAVVNMMHRSGMDACFAAAGNSTYGALHFVKHGRAKAVEP